MIGAVPGPIGLNLGIVATDRCQPFCVVGLDPSLFLRRQSFAPAERPVALRLVFATVVEKPLTGL